jgi:2TM domain
MTEEDMRRIAVRRVNAKLGFRIHALVFTLVNLGLAAINLAATPAYLWFLFSLSGWGIGLLAHALAVHGRGVVRKEAMIAREMEALRAQADRRR